MRPEDVTQCVDDSGVCSEGVKARFTSYRALRVTTSRTLPEWAVARVGRVDSLGGALGERAAQCRALG